MQLKRKLNATCVIMQGISRWVGKCTALGWIHLHLGPTFGFVDSTPNQHRVTNGSQGRLPR
jgi:hypothetical protein